MEKQKEWVIDEKGLHAKATWETAPADNTAVTVDDLDSAPANTEESNSPYAKIVITSVEMVPGADGFAFNKKFTAKVSVDVKDEKASKKVTFRLFCRYKGEEFEIVPEEYGSISGDKAEKEMTLFYAEKADGCTYYDDSFEDPSLTCEYFLRVSHPDISDLKESEPITMPQSKILMKKYCYDDKGASAYNKPASGDNYLAGEDVYKLQEYLNTLGFFSVGKPDGFFGDKTDKAVRDFQELAKEKLRKKDDKNIEVEPTFTDTVDGIVGEKTAKEIELWKEKGYKALKTTFMFPLPKSYQDKGYHKGMRSFGSSRNKGMRAHAGCDLYADLGTSVYAVADGTIRNYYNFYWKTFALEVDHGDFVVRYGEVQPPSDPAKHGISITKDVKDYIKDLKDSEKKGLTSNLKVGSKVTKGDTIAYVGQLYVKNGNVPFKHTMLHFEKYGTNDKGALTQKDSFIVYDLLDPTLKKSNFIRRKDLQNPTKFLDECELKD